MFHRKLSFSDRDSILLFGARGTGKSTLLKTIFPAGKALWVDLLKPEVEARFQRNPEELEKIAAGLLSTQSHGVIVIDEIQKCPQLLNVVHALIESTPLRFVMTGSSARKLRHGSANLLAGRAFVHRLHPLTHLELGEDFDLNYNLNWGSLPKVLSLDSDSRRRQFLNSYALAYLKEEVWAEHLVRKLEPFRRYLEIAAQSDGLIINFSKIAKEVGVDTKTIQTYFDILVETHLGFWLEAFHTSVRKQVRLAPKFYLFDIGVSRALGRNLTVPVIESTSSYGERFEQFVVLECLRLNDYFERDYRFSYFQSKDGLEIDLIVERPGRPLLLVEIKSTACVRPDHLRSLARLGEDLTPSELWCLSRDPLAKTIGDILVLPWREGLNRLFQA